MSEFLNFQFKKGLDFKERGGVYNYARPRVEFEPSDLAEAYVIFLYSQAIKTIILCVEL